MKKYLTSIMLYLLIMACGLTVLIPLTSISGTDGHAIKYENKDSISAKLLFYADFRGNTQDTCILITSQESLKKYTNNNTDIDFNKNAVLILLKPFSSTHHQISFKDICVEQDTLIVRYIYEVTNKEVEGPPKKFCLLIPKAKIPIKVVEHNISDKFEGIRIKELVIENH